MLDIWSSWIEFHNDSIIYDTQNCLNVFLTSMHLWDTKVTKFELIATDVWSFRDFLAAISAVVSQFNGTSTPKGSYSAKTGDNDCNVNSSRYSLRTAPCDSNSLSGQVWTKCPTRPDTQGRHVEAALMHHIGYHFGLHVVYTAIVIFIVLMLSLPLGIDTKIIKFKLIVADLWPFRVFDGYLGCHDN